MMKKINFIALLIVATTAVSLKGQTASDLFVSAPESMLLTLNTTDRLDLIDFYKAGQEAKVENQLGDTSAIFRLTDDYLELKTGNETLELIILHLVNDSKIVCLIQTVCAPVCDSYLAFYTTSWKKIDSDIFIAPADKLWFIKEGFDPEGQKVKNTLIPLDITLMHFHYDTEKQVLYQYYTTPEYVSLDDKTKAEVYLKNEPRIFRWSRGRFE
ncbi:MAG: DUF3256 family protein [Dysgonamonadaceae bacterium]|jgi:hypothetical protein|nr:DUF3256 family protein [Dysgonamonadaceae bacterium]